MFEIALLVLGAFLGWLASRHVEISQSRLSRTLELMDEFNSDAMLLHRFKVWLGRDRLFPAGDFDESLIACDPEEFEESHPLFHLIALMWFFRKIVLLERTKQINRKECRDLIGGHFEMYWTHVFVRARGADGTGAHQRLWADLESLAWLREGFTSDYLAAVPTKQTVEIAGG